MTILCDYGTRYQSKLFNPEFLRSKKLPVPGWMEQRSTISPCLTRRSRDGRKTEALFRDDAYLSEADATVVRINDRGGIMLDRTIFYATSGGQPGDTGRLERADGSAHRHCRHHHRREQGRDHPRSGAGAAALPERRRAAEARRSTGSGATG